MPTRIGPYTAKTAVYLALGAVGALVATAGEHAAWRWLAFALALWAVLALMATEFD